MNGKSGGETFRDTLRERWIARGRCVDTRDYDQLPQEDRDDLEAAAAAVETEQVRSAREDRDQLRAQVLALAAELENEAARADRGAVRLSDRSAGLVLEEQADAKRSAARRIRKIAGAPS